MLRTTALLITLATPSLAQEKTFEFEGITSIDARNGITVNVVQGDAVTVTAAARSGDVSHLKIQKFGGWLALNRNTRWLIFPYGRTDDIVVTITLPELRNIKAFDSATATATGFSGEALRAEAIQGGTVRVTDVSYPEMTLYATEEGALTISGTCETAVTEAVFGAEIMSADLTCANVAATTRMNSNITATATDLASSDSSLGGTITLSGDPEIVPYLPGMKPEEETSPEEGEG